VKHFHLPALLAVLLAGALVLGYCACGTDADPEPAPADEPPAAEPATDPPPAPQPEVDDTVDPLPPADPEVTREALEHHVGFLASDELHGRAAMSSELGRVRDYLVKALVRAGVRPAGDDGTFLRRIPLMKWHHTKSPELVLVTRDGQEIYAVYGVDFQVKGGGAVPTNHGVLRVRHVASEEDLPEEVVPDEALALFARVQGTGDWLKVRGYSARDWSMQLHARPPSRGKEKDLPPSPLQLDHGEDTVGEWVTLRGALGDLLRDDQIGTVDLRFFARKQELVDYNVVGMIEGVGTAENPDLAKEVVVLSAHVDGRGLVEGFDADHVPMFRDVIFNGAEDNASGVGVLLEVVEALAAGPPPARTVVFLFATMGQMGNKGCRHFVENPGRPLEDIVANLHFDTLGHPDTTYGVSGRLWVAGSELTNLQTAWHALDLQAAPDTRPRYNWDTSRGSGVFLAKGIPAHALTSYDNEHATGSIDDEADTLDYDHLLDVARTCLRASQVVLDGSVTPAWIPGHEPND